VPMHFCVARVPLCASTRTRRSNFRGSQKR
jgi:hypothetical protein